MANKKDRPDLSKASFAELVTELARRKMDEHGGEMTMSEMELTLEELKGETGPPSIALMLSRMKPEKSSAKACPRCGKRVPVKAKDRPRTVRSLAGLMTFTRHYHYCEACKHGFYPVDAKLGLPEDGDVTAELEKRILDFGINETFDEAADRWSMHYTTTVSAHLIRSVVERVGKRCESANADALNQELLAPMPQPAEVLIVQNDGSMLPLRGPESWKEAKLAVIYRLDEQRVEEKKRPTLKRARYVSVLGPQEEFSKALESALGSERSMKAKEVVWIGDGAIGNWKLAADLQPGATQILDWHHAVEHAMDCGKILLGETSPLLGQWKRRTEQLLMTEDIAPLISELMDCVAECPPDGIAAIDNLVRYYRSNAARMRYAQFRRRRLPIASGVVESAHRHVLQKRMKRAGQHWDYLHARRMVRMRAAYRTAGPRRCYQAITSAASTRASFAGGTTIVSPKFNRRRASNR
jgi:hypothetical protein